MDVEHTEKKIESVAGSTAPDPALQPVLDTASQTEKIPLGVLRGI